MIATLFGEDGRFRAAMNGQDEACASTAQEMNCRLVAGDYQGHYWPEGEEEPLPCATLPYTGTVTVAPGGDLVLTEGQAGDVEQLLPRRVLEFVGPDLDGNGAGLLEGLLDWHGQSACLRRKAGMSR
jgi:hypothetical protein